MKTSEREIQHRRTVLFILAGYLALMISSIPSGIQAAESTPFDLTKVSSRDATLIKDPVTGFLRLTTGKATRWPGVTLPVSNHFWDLSAFSEIDIQVKNIGTSSAKISCRVDNPEADGTKHCVTDGMELDPGMEETLKVKLMHSGGDNLDGKLFGMVGYPQGDRNWANFDPKEVVAIVLFTSEPTTANEFEIRAIHPSGTYTPPTANVKDADPFFPFVDTFGQYKHRPWPGKIESPSDFAVRREAEEKDLASHPSPEDRDEYGGWASGPKLPATGFFYVEKYQGKWWLVDPKGSLFFSQGIDCVGSQSITPVENRENWFDHFPGDLPEFQQYTKNAYTLLGYYAGRSPRCFSFSSANIQRKYGPDWKNLYPPLIHRRLRSWGINTIGNWSDEKIGVMDQTPYVGTLNRGKVKLIEGSKGYWGKFSDVFDPEFSTIVHREIKKSIVKSADDPWCLGYFVDNEMSWGDETSLALAVCQSPPEQPAKQVWVTDLQKQYGGIEKLNRAWGTSYSSWDAFLANREVPDKVKAHEDLIAFSRKIAEVYFSTVRDAIKTEAPHHLYLGCRFSGVNDVVAKVSAQYCDVVSYNLYRPSVAHFHILDIDKPFIIGEFHFGALDRGMFHTGLKATDNQDARARAYAEYMTGALKNSLCIGAHWFQWQDEPLTGRVFDGENYQIGFIDVADTPYAETIAASREVAKSLYQTRAKN